MTAYSPTVWVNGTAPALNATNLNKLKNELASQAAAKSISHSLPTWANGVPPAISDAAPLNEMERVTAAVATSLGLSYTPTSWASGWVPARNATRFNHMEQQAQANRVVIDVPPPQPGNLPSVISTGGTYTGTANGSGTGAAVRIATTQPVIIQDSVINHSGTGYGIDAHSTAGTDLTVLRTTFSGAAATGQAVKSTNYKRLVMTNCTINGFWGVRGDANQAGGTTLISKCKFNNQQDVHTNFWGWGHSLQFADCLNSGIEVAWCQFINDFGSSRTEDVISLYKTHGAYIHDCGVRGAYPAALGDNYSGGGIMLGDNGGNNNLCEDSWAVGTLNYCLGILGGQGNVFRRCYGVSDSRSDSAQLFTGQSSNGLGIQGWHLQGPLPFQNNHFYDCTIGCTQENGTRNDVYITTGADAPNLTVIRPGQVLNNSDEVTGWNGWLAHLAASGLSIGA